MNTIRFASSHSRRFYQTCCLMLLGLLLVSLLPAVPLAAQNMPVQPMLLEMASRSPQSEVSVIVQKLGTGNEVEKAIASLGGVVTGDLHIINAVSANLPAKAVPELSQSSSVRWISLNAPVVKTGELSPINTANLKNNYIKEVGVDKLWNKYQGSGIGVAVVDSGINPMADFYTLMGKNRIVASVAYNNDWNRTIYDGYGHGTHIAGIIGGNNINDSSYTGVAPMSNLINVKVSNDNGSSDTASLIQGLQWILDNKANYNIRVVNISINSSVKQSYNVDPICAAAEILWFNGIVVVVSAGNSGQASLYAPANDPFVITVGAVNDNGTLDTGDDKMANFSAFGKTTDGFNKPDLVAPGTNIVSVSAGGGTVLAREHPLNVVGSNYFKMSGTSVAAPVVAGTVALMLEANPALNPDQVKYRLKSTARAFDTTVRAGAGYLDAYKAVTGTTTSTANTGTPISKMLFTGLNPVNWSSVNWSSVNWSSVNWSSVNWSSVNWSSVNWTSTYWGN
ncbi:MAG TPA: S8 family peptidase [Chloroflexia bacterium]|nr:S8 family peptidase [Chloroflexia bacterium]